MSKVYVIVCEEVYDFENFEHTPKAYARRKDAITELNNIKEEVVKEFEGDFDHLDEGETWFEIYNDGYYSEGHYSGRVYELEVNA